MRQASRKISYGDPLPFKGVTVNLAADYSSGIEARVPNRVLCITPLTSNDYSQKEGRGDLFWRAGLATDLQFISSPPPLESYHRTISYTFLLPACYLI